MKFLFDVKLFASINVEAATEQEARTMLTEAIENHTANLGSWPSGEPIVVDLSLDDDEPDLIEIDGEAA